MPIIEGGEIDYDPLRGGEEEDEDEETPLINKSDRVLEKEKKFDPYGGIPRRKVNIKETSFNTPLPQELSKDEAVEEIKNKYPEAKTELFIQKLNEFNQVIVSTKNKNSIFHILFKTNGELNTNVPKAIQRVLGPPAEEIIIKNDEKIEIKTKRIEELELQELRTDISPEVKETITNEINVKKEEIVVLNEENTVIKSKMSLRNRIKEIFKKHGFTAFSILTSVGTVIGVIVSNLSSVTANAAKGVTASVTKAIGNGVKAIGNGLKDLGNGLKENGKKIAKILPGIAGAIASFIFKLAGEALGFLAKNAWLLIFLAVTYVIEQYSKGSQTASEVAPQEK